MKALSRLRKEGNGGEGVLETMETGLARFRDEMDRMIDRFWRRPWESPFSLFTESMAWPELKAPWGAWPAIDIAEDDKAVVIRADVPGLEAKDVAVEVSGNALTIRGSREEEETQKTANVTRHERRFGKFERMITLPPHVDAGKVEAKYEKGTLTITVPRIPGEGPKRVEVKTA
jgi:HSP20 family protein